MMSNEPLVVAVLVTAAVLFPSMVVGGCGDATTCFECFRETGQTQVGCTWFADIQFCEDGCGMNGCGASKCANEISTCQECLAQIQHKQYAWSPSDSSCYESCNRAPADAACFPGTTYGPEVCEPAKCSDATTCSECMNATPDQGQQCSWFADIGFCEDGCGMNGCGAAECADRIFTCQDCLGRSTHKQYAWSPSDNTCYESCNQASADASCFPGATYGTEVCESLKCSDATTCSDCMNATPDQGVQCTWFADTGFCEDGCGANGCGAAECADRVFTCQDCLGRSMHKQYAWSPADSSCHESCNQAPADAACFPGSSYGPERCAPLTCADATTCSDCMNAEATSSVGCTWYTDVSGGSCEDGCRQGGTGCGASQCSDQITECVVCMRERRQYAWSPSDKTCYDTCNDAPADAACFPGDRYGYEICECEDFNCEECVSQDKCAWSPVADCLNDCSQAPADSTCFPGNRYGPEICPASFGATPSSSTNSSSTAGDSTTASTATSSSGKVCVAFGALFAVVMGQALWGIDFITT